jgi:uncharacterized protein (DUF427 family)
MRDSLVSIPGVWPRNARPALAVEQDMTPGHTIAITPSDLHVEVHVDGEKVAESDRPVLLEETGLPTRYYLPRDDVRTDLLRATTFSTTCPFKGDASYWSLTVGDQVHDGIVWSYEQPIPGAEGIAGLMCFYDERVELTVRERTAAS